MQGNPTATNEWVQLNIDDIIVHVQGEKIHRVVGSYGIIFNSNGWILTSYHTIADCENLTAKTINGSKTLYLELIDHDKTYDVAVLIPRKPSVFNYVLTPPSESETPPTKSETFNYLEFDESLNATCLSCSRILSVTSEGSFIIFEGIIKEEETVEGDPRYTKIEINCRSTYDKKIVPLGFPIIDLTKKVTKVLGMVTIAFSSSNNIAGIASKSLNLYLDTLNGKWQELKKRLAHVDLKYSQILVCKNEQLAKDFITEIDKLFDFNRTWNQLAREVVILTKKVAPGCTIYEIHFFVKPISLHKESETIYEICRNLHLSFGDLRTRFNLTVISYLYVFESCKWFSIWTSKLKKSKEVIQNMMKDNRVIDVLFSVQLLCEKEYQSLKKKITNKRSKLFVEVMSNRYPSDIAFIVEALQVKQLRIYANYFKELMENTMNSADPFKCLSKSSQSSDAGTRMEQV